MSSEKLYATEGLCEGEHTFQLLNHEYKICEEVAFSMPDQLNS